MLLGATDILYLFAFESLLLGLECFEEMYLDRRKLILRAFAEAVVFSVGFEFSHFCRYGSGMSKKFFA